jgi:hypothetical protein
MKNRNWEFENLQFFYLILRFGNWGKKELEERESKKKDLVAENYDEGEAAMPRQLLELKHEYSQSHVGFVSCTYKFTTNEN